MKLMRQELVTLSSFRELNQSISEKDGTRHGNSHSHHVLPDAPNHKPPPQALPQVPDCLPQAMVGFEHLVPNHIQGIRQGRPCQSRRRALVRRPPQCISLCRRTRCVNGRENLLHEILDDHGRAVLGHCLKNPRRRAVPHPPQPVVDIYKPKRLTDGPQVSLGILKRDGRPHDGLIHDLHHRAHREGGQDSGHPGVHTRKVLPQEVLSPVGPPEDRRAGPRHPEDRRRQSPVRGGECVQEGSDRGGDVRDDAREHSGDRRRQDAESGLADGRRAPQGVVDRRRQGRRAEVIPRVLPGERPSPHGCFWLVSCPRALTNAKVVRPRRSDRSVKDGYGYPSNRAQ
mmetsp:Transcript_9563/g.28702  ORF Transcript_9563/g.28702 Transcript_9563/m.28702 type:complete len:342 (-) Transcript_9563:115-1140(-)